MNGTGLLSKGYTAPAQQSSRATQHTFFFFFCLNLPVDLDSSSLAPVFTEVAEDRCQAPREFWRSGRAAVPFLLDLAKCQPLSDCSFLQ